ncbi:thioesterase family protein [Amphritea sp. 1_MG-2023]|uniref:thioesterase family protein n=1 Tax=Amphritea sp. 1_MG-2023 TaxID=3062670 RepID=UPI0026E149AA|nr:thioesterase family protein [Amphritea sp. 1_MG-2023]MDO6565113.1 thioesterase family protein [Amphritea sp. 1_MG-2023]
MPKQAPIIYRTHIKPEWLDYNNHMNVAYYVLIFDLAGTELVSQLGLSEAVTNASQISWMVLENHITYNNEVVLDQLVEVRCQLIDHDSKRLHLYFEMFAQHPDGSEYLASTLEQMAMCVDLSSRSSCPFPVEIAENIATLAAQQSTLASPANIGRKIGIRRA